MPYEDDRARTPGFYTDLFTDSQSVFVKAYQVGDCLTNRIVDRRCRHPCTSVSLDQWTAEGHCELKLHNLKRPIGPDQWNVILVALYQPAVGHLVTYITSAKDPVVTANGLLKPMFVGSRVLDHLAENGKTSGAMLELNCPQECLPVGIGCQCGETLRRHC